MSYNTKNYTEQGGEKTVIGGTLEIKSDAQINGLSELYTTTLTALGWADTSGNAPFTQTVNIQGILATDTPIIDVVLSSTTDTAKSQLEAFSCLSKIETADGSITATCLDTKPTIDIPIKLKVIR